MRAPAPPYMGVGTMYRWRSGCHLPDAGSNSPAQLPMSAQSARPFEHARVGYARRLGVAVDGDRGRHGHHHQCEGLLETNFGVKVLVWEICVKQTSTS